MPETVQEYTQRLLSYAGDKDPLRLQQAAPARLASLVKGRTRKQLTRKPAPDKWSIGAHSAGNCTHLDARPISYRGEKRICGV